MKLKHLFSALLLIVGLAALNTAVAQSISRNGNTRLPGYTPTGNPVVDAVNYATAKTEWIKAHPEEYKALSGDQLPWGAPENKAAWAAAHPAEYEAYKASSISGTPWKTPEGKDAWINAHPNEYKAMTKSEIQDPTLTREERMQRLNNSNK
jgi:hypothetical protein